ncbi:MAG: hypothetical protein AAFT19_02495, partial [Pseudomonadota bacterium]
EAVPAAQTGRDGHPAPGVHFPDTGLPRRMWAAGELEVFRPLPLGATAVKTTTVGEPVRKLGRSGPLAFVSAVHEITGRDGLALRERQDIVYREDPDPGAPPAPHRAAPSDETMRQAWSLGPEALFRYSALTYNGHRIHYDLDYARRVEGYAGLVVHGPLLATLMLETAAAALPDRFRPHFTGRFTYRAAAPVIAHERFETCIRLDGDGAHLWVRVDDGRLAMEGRID